MFSVELGPSCYYCGQPADERDHVFPRSMPVAFFTAESASMDRYRTVPACHECNHLLVKYFQPDLSERKAELKRRLRKKYYQLLQMRGWTTEELEALEPRMASHVRFYLSERDRIRRRLAF